MNYIKKTIFFVFILLLNVGCGRDGTDGDIYLRIEQYQNDYWNYFASQWEYGGNYQFNLVDGCLNLNACVASESNKCVLVKPEILNL